MLTTEEVRSGYWGENWLKIPEPITEITQYQGGEVLALSCTQLSTTAARQKRNVAEWCDALPYLTAVKTLCFNTRANQRLFDAAAQMPNLEVLYVKWGGIKSVASLAGSKTLRVLHLGSNPSIQDIEQVRTLSQLSVLELENIPGARNLEFVAGLVGLEALGVDGSMWTRQPIESLEPLMGLLNLKYLSLTNAKVRNGGLMPLAQIKSLVHVKTAIWYPSAEFEALRAELPMLKYGTPLEIDEIREYLRHMNSKPGTD